MKAVERNRYICQTEKNPSFSSTLLDIIYRSIDEKDNEEPVMYRKSAAYFKNSSIRNESNSFNFNSNIDSRYRSRFQSTESTPKPKPIRTRNDEHNECKHKLDDLKPDSNFMKTKKSRAMMKKIYSYLNKGKQPISPGARLSTFLISLFTTTNTKKSMISSPCNGGHDDAIIHPNIKLKSKSKSKSKMAPNSVSTSSSSSVSGKLNSGMKQSVRFYPASVFIDESIHRNSVSINGNCKIEETGRNLIKKCQKKVEIEVDSIENNVIKDNDDDDDVSSASSDLFELDHFTAIQELPLYETTSIDTNRAIANGLIL